VHAHKGGLSRVCLCTSMDDSLMHAYMLGKEEQVVPMQPHLLDGASCPTHTGNAGDLLASLKSLGMDYLPPSSIYRRLATPTIPTCRDSPSPLTTSRRATIVSSCCRPCITLACADFCWCAVWPMQSTPRAVLACTNVYRCAVASMPNPTSVLRPLQSSADVLLAELSFFAVLWAIATPQSPPRVCEGQPAACLLQPPICCFDLPFACMLAAAPQMWCRC